MGRKVLVKICGIRDLRDLKIVERFAEFTGVVVEAESKRKVSISEARRIIEEAEIPVFVVSTKKSFEEWSEIIEKSEAEFIQIHSEVEPLVVEKLKKEYDVYIMKAFEVPLRSEDPWKDAEKLVEMIDAYEVDTILLDSGRGSGTLHDLRISKIIAMEYGVFLAGGLTPENIRKILQFVNPLGVDVSSGVERNGRKDEELIRAFIEEVSKYEHSNL
jgi:phosphoribosylanthranilate isomerase